VSVARGASYIMIQLLVTDAAMAISFSILARLIAQKEMGILAVLTFVTNMSLTVAGFGLPEAVTRFVSGRLSRGESDIASIFYQAIRITSIFAGLLGAVVFAGASFVSVGLLGDTTYTAFFQILAADILVYAGALPILTSMMLGLHRFKQTAAFGILNALVRQSMIILLVIAFRNFVGLVTAWVAADFLATSIYITYLWAVLGRPRFDFPLRTLVNFSWPLWLRDIVAFSYAWFDRALLLFFVPLATLGVYYATIMAFNVLDGISGAIATALLPTYSALQQPSQRQTLSDTARFASRYSSFVVTPLALGLLATSKGALTLFVGEAYAGGAGPLMILSGVIPFTLLGTLLTPMLSALGETRVASAIKGASLVIGLLAAFALVPLLGLIGASLARVLAMILGTVFTIVIVTRKVSIRLDFQAISKSLIAGIVMATVVLAVQIPYYDKFLLPVYVVVGGIVYLAMLRILRTVRQEDIDLMREYLGHRLAFAADLLAKVLL